MPKKDEIEAPEAVPGPDGKLLTRQDLPPFHERRWGAKRKAQVVAAVENGLLSLTEARRLYSLSVEELVSWQRALHSYGTRGLQAISLRLSERRDRRRRQRTVHLNSKALRHGGGHV